MDRQARTWTRYRPSRIPTLILLAVLSWTAAGCDLQVVEEEVTLRYDPVADTLDVELTYLGVTAPEPTEATLVKALAAARRVLAGRREFMVLDWPFYWDLDAPDASQEETPGWTRIRSSVSLSDVTAFLDDRGRLSGAQRLRIVEVSALVAQINESFSRWILETSGGGDLEKETPLLDEESRRRWIERARAAHRWFFLETDGIVVDLPMTPEATAGFLRATAKDLLKSEPDEIWPIPNLMLQIRRAEATEQGVRLRFGEPRDGTLRFHFHRPDVRYDPTLLEALRKEGVNLEPRNDVR